MRGIGREEQSSAAGEMQFHVRAQVDRAGEEAAWRHNYPPAARLRACGDGSRDGGRR
jgi:hypothetical protein